RRSEAGRLTPAAVLTTVVLTCVLVAIPPTSSGRDSSVPALLLNDGWVRVATPHRGDGTGTRLEVGRRPTRVAYLEFLVSDVGRAPRHVTLRLRSRSRSDGAGIDLRTTRSAGWDEDRLTSGAAPRPGKVLRHHSRFRRGWIT